MPCPYFSKLMLLPTIHDKKLDIPQSFVKKFGHELASVATLILPDGHVWQVGLRRSDDQVWFCDGWQEFKNYFAIRIGFFLLFRYQGKSTFSINIFNLPSSEINYQIENLRSVGEPKGNACHLFEELEDDKSVEIGGFNHPCSVPGNNFLSQSSDKFSITQGYSAPTTQNLFNGSSFHDSVNKTSGNQMSMRSTRDTGIQVNANELQSPAKRINSFSLGSEGGSNKSVRKRRKSNPEKQGSSNPHDEETEARIRFYESASVRKRTVTAEERERTLNAAKQFEPTNPFCRVVLRPSYLYRGCIMHLPSCFAEKHLNGVSGFIKLQNPAGKQWPVRCLYRSLYKGGRAKFSQGWYEFSLENNLEEGDVCVFERLDTPEVTLRVTIFRVEATGQVQQSSQQNVDQTRLIKN